MKGSKKIFVLIPAFNEERSIGAVVRHVLRQRQVQHCIVVDDCSSDNTAQSAKDAGALVLRKKYNSGTGAAVQYGLLHIQKYSHDVVILMDADGQHDPKYIPSLIFRVKKGADYVIASRYIYHSDSATSWLRRYGTRCVSLLISFVFGARVYDATSGYRAFNSRVFKELLRHYPTYFSEPEILMQLLERGYQIKEIPSQMRKRIFGSSSISAFKAVQLMVYIIKDIFRRGVKHRASVALSFCKTFFK